MFDDTMGGGFCRATLNDPLFAADPADVSSARQVATFAALDVDGLLGWPLSPRGVPSLPAMREGARRR